MCCIDPVATMLAYLPNSEGKPAAERALPKSEPGRPRPLLAPHGHEKLSQANYWQRGSLDIPPCADARSESSRSASHEPSWSLPQAQAQQSGGRNALKFVQRSEQEVQDTVRQWLERVHPRAMEYFASSDTLEAVLSQIARGLAADGEDAIFGPGRSCAYWYGDVSDDGQAAIEISMPSKSGSAVTYVNRVVTFMFATDELFKKLLQLPKEPFRMRCGEQLCVHLCHISDCGMSGDG